TDPTPGPDGIDAVALQKDGKIVVAGVTSQDSPDGPEPVPAVARYLPLGTLDPAFGSDGIESGFVSGNASRVHALAVQRDGKIVVAGGEGVIAKDTRLIVARLLKNGQPDFSFDRGGSARIDGAAEAFAVALQKDG